MNWNALYSPLRNGDDKKSLTDLSRSNYQQDFDRLVFSTAFRRLQNKTQVFPLPEAVFVHNRLTHSLEVSSVGRTLGTRVGNYLSSKADLTDESKAFYAAELKNVIAAACLCHDIGNPAFGHSGENAISNYFKSKANQWKSIFNEKEWADLVHFEGNANAIRVLAQKQKGKLEGGFRLTYTTLASIAKYPCAAIARDKRWLNQKKYGFFQSEKEIFERIALHTGMEQTSADPLIYKRHPFVYLVEAADDICYNIIDMEDAHKLKIIDYDECSSHFMNLMKDLPNHNSEGLAERMRQISDTNEKIAYLRSVCISGLIEQCVAVFVEQEEAILDGSFNAALVDYANRDNAAWQAIQTFSIKRIYQHASVVEIELAGHQVLQYLLDMFMPPILEEKLEGSDQIKYEVLRLLPAQFALDGSEAPYQAVRLVLDFLAGMTDHYAVNLYRKIKGIQI